MTKFAISASVRLAAAVLAATLSAGAANAALTFDTWDCDSDRMADWIGGYCAQKPLTAYSVDVLYTDADRSGGGATEWAFKIVKDDVLEIFASKDSWNFTFSDLFPGGTISKTASEIVLHYVVSNDLTAGTRIGTLSFTTGSLLTPAPADGAADISMVTFGDNVNATTMFDPGTGTLGGTASFEVQAVPLPASAVLLVFGVAALGGLRRRS